MDSFILGGGEMEYWDAYNEQRERQGDFLKRGQPIAEGQYHLCVNVFVRHIDGEFLLMHRSPKKKFILIIMSLVQEGVCWLVKIA